QDERSGDVRVDKPLRFVRDNVRLMQRRDMQHTLHTGHPITNTGAIRDRRTFEHIHRDHVMTERSQRAAQRITEMPAAASDQDPHHTSVRIKCTSGSSSTQYAPGGPSGIPTLPALTIRRPSMARSNCTCVCPHTTSGCVTPANMRRTASA